MWKGTVTCSGKRGHDQQFGICDYDEVEDTSLEVCSVEAGKRVVPISHRARQD